MDEDRRGGILGLGIALPTSQRNAAPDRQTDDPCNKVDNGHRWITKQQENTGS